MMPPFTTLTFRGRVLRAAAQRQLYEMWCRGGPMTVGRLAVLIAVAEEPATAAKRAVVCASALDLASRLVQRWRQRGLIERALHGGNQGWVPRRA